ncbi:TetR/AcrR family transcriptional regulator [Microbacterium sp. C7(2022)]|uniref:TetR/AcrR family transcriptional regulator n=1 Tax=Microbacterium sp. C7(2022) TaxID=2992759 RepID=UPI00237B4A76|nr:TetR/AcrR family transcriptional regulator [Microbacterium sp. C7(2022)]MDE0546846.1 TetR/AcrR family transcriptional regulator [Microbacterium sp. C7(2022)]
MTSGATDRDRAKADRSDAILRAAARLFAERGFSGVSLEELGNAVGITGPALYRHFAGKQALLGAILVSVSERLLAGGREVAASEIPADERLRELIRFHVDFAVTDADVIRVHDRDLASLTDTDRHTVRRLQREYIDVWTDTLGAIHPDRAHDELRLRAHAAFGLINSTPHSVRGIAAPNDATVRRTLESMAYAALVC